MLQRRVARGPATSLEFWIEADTFLRHMNRVLVGTMLEVAAGRLELDGVRRAAAGQPRSHAGPTAPAHGLALVSVAYPGWLIRVRAHARSAFAHGARLSRSGPGSDDASRLRDDETQQSPPNPMLGERC